MEPFNLIVALLGGLMGVALRIPRECPRRQWRTVLVLIGAGMLLMWGVSTLLVALILGLPLGLAALIGAIITPTDPVAASPIVTGDLAEANIPTSCATRSRSIRAPTTG